MDNFHILGSPVIGYKENKDDDDDDDHPVTHTHKTHSGYQHILYKPSPCYQFYRHTKVPIL